MMMYPIYTFVNCTTLCISNIFLHNSLFLWTVIIWIGSCTILPKHFTLMLMQQTPPLFSSLSQHSGCFHTPFQMPWIFWRPFSFSVAGVSVPSYVLGYSWKEMQYTVITEYLNDKNSHFFYFISTLLHGIWRILVGKDTKDISQVDTGLSIDTRQAGNYF